MAVNYPMRDMLRRAFRAKDAAEFEEIEREAEKMPPPDEENGHDHIHLHLGGGGSGSGGGNGHDQQEVGGGEDPDLERGPPPEEGDVDQDDLADRLEAIERGIEEMRADHEEMQEDLDEIFDEAPDEGESHGMSDRFCDAMRRVRDRRRRGHDEAEEERKESPPWMERDKRYKRFDTARDARRSARDEGANSESAAEPENKDFAGNLEMEAPPGTATDARKARDSAYLEDSWQETVALAEMLAPGGSYPTFDRAAKPGATFDQICDLRRRTLDTAYSQPHLESFLDMSVGGDFAKHSKTMDCGAIRVAFRSAALMQRGLNNSSTNDSPALGTNARGAGGGQGSVGGVTNIDALQKRHNEFWANQR